jgi:arabinofuranosyltransferase
VNSEHKKQKILFSREERLVFFVSLLALFLLMISFNGYSTDDAYISYRYAANLAAGNGLVYNPHMPAVEGYSNFLWTVLLSLAALTKLPLAETGSFLSALFSVFSIMLIGLWAFQQREYTADFSVAIPMLLFAFSPAVGLWSTTGMETTFFTFMLLTCTLVTAWEERVKRSGWISGLLWSAVVLTRPEGIFFVLCFTILPQLESGKIKERKNTLLQRVLIPVSTCIVQAIWRYAYYGDWLPNTFYAKSGPIAAMLPFGFHYFLNFLKVGGGALIVLMVLSLLVKPKISGSWTIGITFAGYACYTIIIGGDWMPASRFFIPILPFLIMISSATLVRIGKEFPKSKIIISTLLALHFIISGFNAQKPYLKGSTLKRLMGEPETVDVLKELGLHLKEVADPYALLAALPAGKVPFYSELRTIDIRGLNDRHIAHVALKPSEMTMPGHHKRDTDYVLSQKPDYIVLTGAIPKESSLPIKDNHPAAMLDRMDILKFPDFKKCYKAVRVPLPQGEKDLYYFRRICPK